MKNLEYLKRENFFHLCFFAEGKKTSIDGLKWRDLVVVGGGW